MLEFLVVAICYLIGFYLGYLVCDVIEYFRKKKQQKEYARYLKEVSTPGTKEFYKMQSYITKTNAAVSQSWTHVTLRQENAKQTLHKTI